MENKQPRPKDVDFYVYLNYSSVQID